MSVELGVFGGSVENNTSTNPATSEDAVPDGDGRIISSREIDLRLKYSYGINALVREREAQNTIRHM
jgi:hypothetical protein